MQQIPPKYPPSFREASVTEEARVSTVTHVTPQAFPPNEVDLRNTRTPSPTPSEQRELDTSAVDIDWDALRSWRFWARKQWILYYLAITVVITFIVLLSVFDDEIVAFLAPATRYLHKQKWGWIIPIGIVSVLSFPPLFGQGIVAILCGLTWGIGIGIGIVAAGTFIGELCNFYTFKYWCTARGQRFEAKKVPYACLAKIVRNGGFKIALIVRLSVIPAHFSTAVFSTIGMNVFVFCLAAVFALPKQCTGVFLGATLKSEGKDDKTVSGAVLGVTALVTIVAGWYISREMNRIKPDIIYERRKARQVKLMAVDVPNEPHRHV